LRASRSIARGRVAATRESASTGYDYDEVPSSEEFGRSSIHGDEAASTKNIGYRARRWVVERTHSWLNKYRRILIRWEKKAENYIGMLHLALGLITWRAAGLLG
jgi:transposase